MNSECQAFLHLQKEISNFYINLLENSEKFSKEELTLNLVRLFKIFDNLVWCENVVDKIILKANTLKVIFSYLIVLSKKEFHNVIKSKKDSFGLFRDIDLNDNVDRRNQLLSIENSKCSGIMSVSTTYNDARYLAGFKIDEKNNFHTLEDTLKSLSFIHYSYELFEYSPEGSKRHLLDEGLEVSLENGRFTKIFDGIIDDWICDSDQGVKLGFKMEDSKNRLFKCSSVWRDEKKEIYYNPNGENVISLKDTVDNLSFIKKHNKWTISNDADKLRYTDELIKKLNEMSFSDLMCEDVDKYIEL